MQQYKYNVVYFNANGDVVTEVEKQCEGANPAEAEQFARDAATLGLSVYEGAVSFDIY